MSYIRIFILFLLPLGFLQASDHKVLVSIAPYVTFCDELTDNKVDVELLVPAGFSSHTYEPAPKQVLSCLNAKVWFAVGELFELKLKTVLKNENPALVIVDLRKGLSLLSDSCHHHHHGEQTHDHMDADPHIWMSPKMMQTQVKEMAQALCIVFPDLEAVVTKNLTLVLAKLQALDVEIHTILAPVKGDTVYVSHPAYGYFCREYDLKQVAIEFEGKDPTPRELTDLLKNAKKAHVHTLFVQPQYSTKAAQIIARELNAELVILNPYAQEYFESMRQIAKSFAAGAVLS